MSWECGGVVRWAGTLLVWVVVDPIKWKRESDGVHDEEEVEFSRSG